MTAITKLSDRFTEADIDQEIVIMTLDSGEFLSLSGTAATIWRLIDGSRDRDSLLAALTEQYGGDQGAITADVDAFLRQLSEAGLVAA